jgi:CheY-like chemotaxis protein
VIKKAANISRKAIVVDNDFFFVEFLSELLEARGYQVIRTYDGKEAKSKLEQQNFDLIFVDMVMPKMDGRELIRFVRSTFPDVFSLLIFRYVPCGFYVSIHGLNRVTPLASISDVFLVTTIRSLEIPVAAIIPSIAGRALPANSD